MGGVLHIVPGGDKTMSMFKGGISLGGHQWRIQGGSMASVTSKTDC